MTTRVAVLLLVASIVACTMKPGAPPSARRGPALVVVRAGSKRPATDADVVFAEIAATPEARQRGLGGRDRLAENAGMLFVYPEEETHRFWMKDCLIGLDIAFIDGAGRIVNVATLPPGAGLPDAEIPAADSRRPARWVLETADGWFARHGIGAGDEVDLAPALRPASR